MTLNERLAAFAKEKRMIGKGPLCVALVVTRHAVRDGLPLDADKLLTDAGGQVSGLGRANVQAILKEHGIDRVLAEEGGRTSRGSIGNMRACVELLNALHVEGWTDRPPVSNRSEPAGRRVTYNPHTDEQFMVEGRPLTFSTLARLTEKGQAFCS